MNAEQRDSLDDALKQWKTAGGADFTDVPGNPRPYRDSPWVYSAVSAIARNVAQIPFKFWLDKKKGTELDPKHWLSLLFDQPNPLMSGYELWYGTEVFLNLHGNALWVPVPGRQKGVIAELWLFGGQSFTPWIQSNQLLGYEVTWAGGREKFEVDEVLHLRYYNPYDPIMGMGPMQAARSSIDQDWWANKYNEAFFKNFAEPGVIIRFPGEYNKIVMDRSKESWDQRHQGFNRAKKTAVLWGGAEISELSTNKRDMQFMEQKKWSREEQLAIFRVPPVEVMLMDVVSSRVEAQRAQRSLFGEEVIAPELKMLEGRVQVLLKMWLIEGVEGYFDTSEVDILQESLSEKADLAKKLFDMTIPINAIIEKLDLGFEALPWGDEGFIASTLVPASSLVSGNGGDNPPADEPPPDDEPTDNQGPQARKLAVVRNVRANKLRRVLFELRNDMLDGKDGLAIPNWERAERKLKGVVNQPNLLIKRLMDWYESATKAEIKRAYSLMKREADDLADGGTGEDAEQEPEEPG